MKSTMKKVLSAGVLLSACDLSYAAATAQSSAALESTGNSLYDAASFSDVVSLPGFSLGAPAGLVASKGVVYGSAHTLLTLPAFWYGLAVAAVMFAAAVYLRRFRDES